MYAFLDQPVGRLCDGSRFTLWAMRGWTQSIARRRCPPAALASGFRRYGVVEALPHFHMAMMMLNHDGIEKLTLAPMDTRWIVEDEAVLLRLWQGMAAEDVEQVRDTLALLVEQDCISPLVAAMRECAAWLSTGGLAPVGLRREPSRTEPGNP